MIMVDGSARMLRKQWESAPEAQQANDSSIYMRSLADWATSAPSNRCLRTYSGYTRYRQMRQGSLGSHHVISRKGGLTATPPEEVSNRVRDEDDTSTSSGWLLTHQRV